MKKRLLFLSVAAFFGLMFASCGGNDARVPEASSDVKLNTSADTLAWVLGEQMGKQFLMVEQYNGLTLDSKVVEQAFCNALEGRPSAINESLAGAIYQRFSMMASQHKQSDNEAMEANATMQEADYFKKLVAENPKVKRHSSGIYYEVVKQGSGRNAQYADQVTFDYKGYNMLTGKIFDQTYGNRPPITHVIGTPMFQGLIEGLQLMNAGSIYRLYIPNQMAFGAQGTQDIPPYTPVIYEVELREILQ